MTGEVKISVSDTHRAAMRAFLGDMEKFVDEYADDLEKDANPVGFSMLTSFTNGILLRRRFGPGCPLPDVVRYVALLRASDESARALDARMIENTIRTHLDDPSLTTPPPFGGRAEEMVESMITVLLSLVAEAGLDDKGIEELVEEAAADVEAHELDPAALPVTVPPEVMELLRQS
jgi:hypothetical protein